jgi:rhamnose utilization protein RhaD (predicted bifunctional aldolase and dehydrogenase)
MPENAVRLRRYENSEITSLLELSARVGRDPLLVQASNGNASIKIDGVLWIKASGKWLADANHDETLVPVDLSDAKEAVRNNVSGASIHLIGREARPSIETPMHAVLPYRIVLHVHSINTIAWAVRQDAQEKLARRLAGLRWKWIPYVPSGVPLAGEIEKVLSPVPSCEEANVFILGNHGLVVCGDHCEAVEALLAEVERRLSIVPRKISKPETSLLAFVAHSAHWRLPDLNALHQLGTDPITRKILKAGVLYPCQAVYLGRNVRMVPHSIPLCGFAEYANGRGGAKTFVIVEDGGIILNRGITSEEEATLIGLMRVLQRTEEFAPIKFLTPTELMVLESGGPHPYLDLANAEVTIETRDNMNLS